MSEQQASYEPSEEENQTIELIRRGDWVEVIMSSVSNAVGVVRRVSKDGTWADVRWYEAGEAWSKRMRCSCLAVKTRLMVGNVEVTDITREQELKGGVRVEP